MIGSQKDYADHIGKSKQYVNKLVRNGRIPVRDDGRIDFTLADQALKGGADPARTLDAEDDDAGRAVPPEAGGGQQGGLTFSKARTVREGFQAKLAQLEYEREVGRLISRREVEDAMIAAGRTIRQGMDAIPGMADEIIALVVKGGGPMEVRQMLREKVRQLERLIVDSLTVLGGGDEQEA